jgi:hypothetical protein
MYHFLKFSTANVDCKAFDVTEPVSNIHLYMHVDCFVMPFTDGINCYICMEPMYSINSIRNLDRNEHPLSVLE